MRQFVVAFSALIAAVSGFSITGPGVQQCVVNSAPLPLAASVQGCTASPCLLPQLEDVVIDIVFRASRDTSALTGIVVAYLSLIGISIPVEYDLDEKSSTCNSLLNSSCPVMEDDILLYTLRVHIDSFFPVGSAIDIEFKMQDDKHEAMSCLLVPIVIQQPRTHTAALTKLTERQNPPKFFPLVHTR